MIALGRTLWIASLVSFLGVAFLYPVTVATRGPAAAGLSGLDELLRYSIPREVINLPAVANQLLAAIGLAATFVAGVAGVAVDAIGLLVHEGRVARVRGTALDPAISAASLTEEDLASIGITWDGENWISPNGHRFKPKHLDELVGKVRAMRLAE